MRIKNLLIAFPLLLLVVVAIVIASPGDGVGDRDQIAPDDGAIAAQHPDEQGAHQPAQIPAPPSVFDADEDALGPRPGSIAGATADETYGDSPGVGGGPDFAGTDAGLGLAEFQVGDRKIIVTAIIDLTVDSPGGSIQQVENIAISAGGFVSGSSLTVEPIRNRDDDDEGPAERERGTITIRVPVSQYASVMNQLRGLGERMSENSQANEVTEEYADLQSRLRNLEATEARYLELLTQAESINDILTVQDRLSQVRLQIEQIQGRINLLDDLSDLATITVNLAMPPDDIEQQTIEEDDEPHWARQAWDDAWSASEEVLQTLGTIGITAGVILMWLLVPGLLIVLGWRLWPRGAGREV